MVVVIVELEMLVKMVDSCRENGNLNLGRACVAFVHSVVRYDLLFLVFKQCFSPHKIFCVRASKRAAGEAFLKNLMSAGCAAEFSQIRL